MVQYATALSKCAPINRVVDNTLLRISMSDFSNHLGVTRDAIGKRIDERQGRHCSAM